MQELINNFGVNGWLLLAQVVNFLIILWLLKRFAYKPIFKLLNDRRQTIAEGIKNAEDSSKALQNALEEEKQILKKAQSQAQDILTEAQNQAQQTIADAESAAKVKVEKILEDATASISRQTKEAEKFLALHTTGLAVDLLEKSLKNMLDGKEQKYVIEKVVKKLKA